MLGHSSTSKRVETRKVPFGVTLVLLSSCLMFFNNDVAMMDAFKNQTSLNKFLEPLQNTNSANVKRLKGVREIYHGGDEYPEHHITMPKENRGMLHGVYNLPRNFKTVRRNNAMFNTRNNESTMLSGVLDKVSRGGGGVVFGAFCRSLPGVVSLSTWGAGSSPDTVRLGLAKRKFGKGGLSTYMGLRPLSTRAGFMSQVHKATNLKRRVPRPSSAGQAERIKVRVPMRFKIVSKPKPPAMRFKLKLSKAVQNALRQ